jgi:hypothetical protein
LFGRFRGFRELLADRERFLSPLDSDFRRDLDRLRFLPRLGLALLFLGDFSRLADRFFPRDCFDSSLSLLGRPNVPSGISRPAKRARVMFLSDSDSLGCPRRFLASLRSISSFSLCVVAIAAWVILPPPAKPSPRRRDDRRFLFFLRPEAFGRGGAGERVLEKEVT